LKNKLINLKNLKNIKSLLIATNNKGKLSEIKKLLPKHITFYSPKDFNLIEPIENEKTFEGNSVIKARYCAEKSKLISLSDDSGLEVSALNGDPGVYSARWAGKNKDFKLAIKKVYSKIKKKNKLKKNNARFYFQTVHTKPLVAPLMVKFHKNPKVIMDLAMIPYLFQMVIKKLLER